MTHTEKIILVVRDRWFRVRCAINILRGRPTAYHCSFHGGELVDRPGQMAVGVFLSGIGQSKKRIL